MVLALFILLVIRYLFRDILNFILIIGFLYIIVVYKFEAVPMLYEGILNLLSSMKGVLS